MNQSVENSTHANGNINTGADCKFPMCTARIERDTNMSRKIRAEKETKKKRREREGNKRYEGSKIAGRTEGQVDQAQVAQQ